MSFGDRDSSKRKYQWTAYNGGAKRFHGSSNSARGEFQKGVGSRWDRCPKPHEQGYSKSHRSGGNTWGSRERCSYSRLPHPTNNRNYNQVFDIQPSVSSGSSKESDELVGPGSDLERMEKVLATKKRIEEALASNSSKSTNKEISFQNSSTDSGDKSKEKETYGLNLDLSLTNSDFREIGSVASAVTTEREAESTDLITNTSSNTATCTSQKRSFDTTTSNLPVAVQTPQPKSQKVGGWSMSSVNNVLLEQNQTCSPRPRNDMYLQEQREEILGNVSAANQENDQLGTPSKHSNDHKNNCDEFSRVGRLYQSFLKSRLYGYTLRVRDNSQKLLGPNPLLDKSVLESQNINKSVTDDQVIELQMPQPIRVKMENLDRNLEQTPEHIAAEEANEFCKEFSFLLKDPNFLIPPDDLEKLGLGHLSELNRLINDRRSGGTSQSSVENQETLQTRNLGVLNSVARSDMGVHNNIGASQFRNNHSFGERESADRCNERDSLLNNGNSNLNISSPMGSHNPPIHDETLRSDILRNENMPLTQKPQVPAFQNVSVEEVVKNVVKSILQPTIISTTLNSSNPSTPEPRTSSTKNANENNLPSESGTSSNDTRNGPLNVMQDVSSKILRLFLIDKQVEELMSEKMKIYTELLSSQGVSQTLFHTWAQDQIQQGNVMNIVSNTSNVIPELNRVINHNVQEINLPQTSYTLGDNSLEEAISELYSLKKEFANPEISAPQAQESEPCGPGIVPPDSCFLTPKDVVEENRPKLSVRKDLLDPNRSHVSLLAPIKVMQSNEDNNVNPNDGPNPEDLDKTNLKREKKKKKTKKKDSVPAVINLIEDTDDEISSGTGIDSTTTDDLSSKGLNSEDEMDRKDNCSGNSKIAYDLDTKTATCMAIMKVNSKSQQKSTKVMVVGCKDGFIMGYALGNPVISFSKKIHNDTITSVFYTHKYLITGSSDSAVCLFSLKEQVEIQTLSVNAPVQSMDMNFDQLIVGTKTGSIYSYTIRVVKENKKNFVSLHPNKKSLSITNSSILAVKLAKEGVRRVLIVASRGEQITVRDANNGLLLRTFDWCDTVYCLQLYKETPLVYCGTNTKSVKVVNYTDGENAGDCMIGRSITQIAFHQSIMFAASHDGNIYIYNVEEKSLMATVIISKGIIQCLGIDGKSNVILVASSRGDLQQIPFPPSVTKYLRLKNPKKSKTAKKKQTENISMAQL